MRSIALFFCFVFTLLFHGHAQKSFLGKETLSIKFSVSIREIRGTKQDSVYLPNKLYYKVDDKHYDTIQAEFKSRGNYRLKNCHYPPLWIKFNKQNAKETIFEKNRKLKLVLPCDEGKDNNDLIVKEFICYKLCELFTPYYFKSRLVDVDFTELRGEKARSSLVKGILIEDGEDAAKRFDAKEMKEENTHLGLLEDTNNVRVAIFQYLIGNTDWSVLFQHNIKNFKLNKGNIISVPYDFDMSGLVDAPYAVISQINGEQLPIQHVTDRLYRGYCQSESVMQLVRKDFLDKKGEVFKMIDSFKTILPESDISTIHEFVTEFFTTLSSDELFKKRILKDCREL